MALKKRLGEIALLQRGLTYNKGDEVPSSSKIVLRSNNIDLESHSLDLSELKYLREDFVIPEDRKVKKDSIFICMSNGSKQHVGKVAFIDRDMDYAFGGFMGLIVPKISISAKYVFYACNSSSYRTFLSQIGNGIGITNLRFSELEKFEIPVPSIEEQQRIVDELDLLTGIIDKKNAQLRDMDALEQSIFYEMFGSIITNEKNWPLGSINDICAPKSAIKRASKSYLPSDSIEYIDISSIDNNSQKLTGTTPYIFSEAPSRAQQVVLYGDVLISLVRPNLKNIAVVDLDHNRLVASSGFCVLRANNHSNPFFIKSFIGTDAFTQYLMDRVTGANYPAVKEDDIKGCRIGIPPVDIQTQFAERIEEIERQKQLVTSALNEVVSLLSGRMDCYFNQ